MKFATHATYGILSGLVYAVTFTTNVNGMIVSVALSTLGSALPDIDSKSSTISNMLLFPKLLPVKHRGFCHSVTLATAVTCINVPLGIGMFSHIALDLLNYRKVKLFAPFTDKGYCLKFCKSDGTMDEIIRALGSCAIVLVLLL